MEARETGTKDRILQAAAREFLQKGYQGAWLRTIAKEAHVTTGALYGYFRNKEELFGALVEPAYEGIQDQYRQILRQFAEMPAREQMGSMEEHVLKGVMELSDFLYDHLEAFQLLMTCAGDTPYGDLVEKMVMLDEQATRDFTRNSEAAGAPVRPMPPRLEHILTTGLFTMFFELVVHRIPREEARDYLTCLTQFYTAGCGRVMGF